MSNSGKSGLSESFDNAVLDNENGRSQQKKDAAATVTKNSLRVSIAVMVVDRKTVPSNPFYHKCPQIFSTPALPPKTLLLTNATFHAMLMYAKGLLRRYNQTIKPERKHNEHSSDKNVKLGGG